MKKLCDANKISSLIKKYNVITVKDQNSDGSSFIRQVLRFDDKIADIQKSGDAVTGFIKGFSFTLKKDRVKAYSNGDRDTVQTTFPKALLLKKQANKELSGI